MSAPAPLKTRPAPFPVRFSEAEKTLLRQKANGRPLGAYIRERALGESTDAQSPRRGPVRDGEALGRLLALLGQSRLASNLNQIAKAVHLGSLPVTVELEADLRRACAEVADMRQLLLRALGLRRAAAAPLTPDFNDLARDSAP